ncbi:MAG TPA: response regulator, partial [Candidatus Tenderia electrophaga]|nr:response regulator [Candidatus Tenderia electrophaga]
MALWSLKGKKILIIDDFAEMRSNLRNMLIPFDGSDISTAGNGDDAIAHISQNIYDIILCDYNLGEGKDGQQVLEEAKLRGQLPYSTVFLMVTAESTTFMVMGALEHQPDDYLTKPFNASILQKRLKKALDKKSN